MCSLPVSTNEVLSQSVLLLALKTDLRRSEISKAQVDKLFGAAQLRVSDLMREKIKVFALHTLVNMASATHLQIEMRITEVA